MGLLKNVRNAYRAGKFRVELHEQTMKWWETVNNYDNEKREESKAALEAEKRILSQKRSEIAEYIRELGTIERSAYKLGMNKAINDRKQSEFLESLTPEQRVNFYEMTAMTNGNYLI